MGEVGMKILSGAGKIAVSFVVSSIGAFVGHALYDTVMQVKDDRREKAAKREEGNNV